MIAVVEVGPVAVRGPGSAALQRSRQAIDCIDDPIALLDDRPLPVSRLWSDVLDGAAGGGGGPLAVVVPTWWPAARVEVLTAAARGLGADVTVLRRAALLGGGTRATVVELSSELVVIAAPGVSPSVLPRDDGALVDLLAGANEVIVDVPAAVAPPDPAVTARLRAAGAPLSFSDRTRVAVAAEQVCAVAPRSVPVARRRRRLPALFAGAALTVAAGAVLARAPAEQVDATAILVEGRVAVRVPADWVAERLTAGPGSARVRVGPLGGSFDDVEDVPQIDHVGRASLGLGPVCRIPAVSCEAQCSKVTNVVTAPAPVVEDRAVGMQQSVSRRGRHGTRQRRAGHRRLMTRDGLQRHAAGGSLSPTLASPATSLTRGSPTR